MLLGLQNFYGDSVWRDDGSTGGWLRMFSMFSTKIAMAAFFDIMIRVGVARFTVMPEIVMDSHWSPTLNGVLI